MKTVFQSVLVIVLICVVMGLIGLGLYHLEERNAFDFLPVQRGFERREGVGSAFDQSFAERGADSSAIQVHRRGEGGNRHTELSPVRGIAGILRNILVIVVITVGVVGIQNLARVLKPSPRQVSRL